MAKAALATVAVGGAAVAGDLAWRGGGRCFEALAEPALDGGATERGLVVADDAAFCAADFDNFLWVAFSRSDPAADVYGTGAVVRARHWSCEGPLLLDARIKPFHAPALEEDPAVQRRVDALAAPGAPLHGLIE